MSGHKRWPPRFKNKAMVSRLLRNEDTNTVSDADFTIHHCFNGFRIEILPGGKVGYRACEVCWDAENEEE